MGVLATDVSVVMSGGSSNTDPNLCLGGNPSGTPITGYLNNLFDNESENDSSSGKTDYRCFYIFNDNDNDTFFDVKVWIASQVEGGANIRLGIPTVSDTQIVTVTGNISGGFLSLSHSSSQFTFQGNTNRNTMATNFQTALSQVPGCAGVTVSAVATTSGTAFTVAFFAGRHHPTLALVDNSLLGDGSIDVIILKTLDGGPINQIASPVSSASTPPTGINFTTPSRENPVIMGNLEPSDGFPVWVQRVCPPGAIGIPNDGAVIRISGKPFSS